MAKDAGNDQAETAEAPAPKKERVLSKFRILIRQKGETAWSEVEKIYEALTQDDAKRDAARALAETEDFGPVIQSDGLELVAVSARGFKPIVVRVEPQPSKLVLK